MVDYQESFGMSRFALPACDRWRHLLILVLFFTDLLAIAQPSNTDQSTDELSSEDRYPAERDRLGEESQRLRAEGEPSDALKVRRSLERFAESKEISGAVALVHTLGKPAMIVVAGEADIEQHRPMKADTLFGIMSMTKPISATALMILVDEGKVSLDDQVEKYIPAFRNVKLQNGQPVRDLRVRHLLSHTSGLSGTQACVESLEATANMLAERPFEFQPGERWKYGPGMNVVGRIVEVASGKPFDKFIVERIFVPLRMDHSTFYPSIEERRNLAVLYRKSDDGASLVVSKSLSDAGNIGSVPDPSGGVFSTVGDLDRFYEMILRGGELEGVRIVSTVAVRDMTAVQTGEFTTGFTPGNGWGLGWCIIRAPQGVTAMLSPGTFGHGGRYGTQGWVDPVKKTIVVLLIQRADLASFDGSEMRKAFQQAAIPMHDN